MPPLISCLSASPQHSSVIATVIGTVPMTRHLTPAYRNVAHVEAGADMRRANGHHGERAVLRHLKLMVIKLRPQTVGILQLQNDVHPAARYR